MYMEERLQKFVKLVDVGSFTKAAVELHISQPALTVAIAKLEREVSSQLFVKGSRPLQLTEAGQVVYRAGTAQAVVLDNLHTDLADLAGKRPVARIGMIDSVAATLCAYTQPLSELEKAADVSVIVNNSRYLRAAVAERALDLAVVIAADKQSAISEKHIGDELMVLVSAPSMLRAKQAELEKGVLSDFICYDQPSKTFQLIVDGLAEQGIEAQTRLQSSSPEVMSRLVVSGNGVAMLPYFMVRGQIVTKSLIVMEHDGEPLTLVRKLNLALPAGKKQAKSVEYFTGQMIEALQLAFVEAQSTVAKMKQKRYHE